MRTMRDVRLIALDLDGTLLTDDKALTPRSRAALEAASDAGIEIVPATGRFYRGIPEPVRSLPFMRYAITINGAQVLDVRTGATICSAEIPVEDALELFGHLDELPVIYDCYIDGWGYMTASMQARAADYVDDAHAVEMIRTLRTPVPELKAHVRATGRSLQKMQLFTRDAASRDALMRELAEMWPQFAISSALSNNVEINACGADKGRALLELASALGIDREGTMAFGDGLNDLPMIRAAGVGVAMANGHPDVRAAADRIAEDNGSEGVAKVIEELLRGGRSEGHADP